MPPEGEGALTADERAIICQWIAAGAKFGDAPAARQLSQHDALPLLLLRCAICHGNQRREGDLDVRSLAALAKGGKSGPAFVPGKPDESLLIKRIRAGEMPPRKKLAPYSVKPVTDDELQTLATWIAAGAPEVALVPDVATNEPDPLVNDADRQFWSFRPPQLPAIPRVKAADRVANPVDAFVLAKQEEGGLTLAPKPTARR